MIRISRKHIAALFLQPLLYVAAHAAEGDSVEPTTSNTTYELRNESKDGSLSFEASADMSIFYDLQNGTSYNSKFSPTLIKKDKGVDRINGFMGANFSLQKTINIFGSDLKFIFTIEKEEGKNSVEFNTYGVESKHIRFGQFAGNFNTYLPGPYRYGAKQFAFKQDLGDGFSYTIGLEEAQASTIHPKEFDEDKSKAKKIEAKINSKDKGEVTVLTTADETEKDQLCTSTRFPRLALVPNFTYKQDWGNIQVNAIATVTEYYNGKKNDAPTKYERVYMFGAALSAKYIAVHNEEFNDKEESIISFHVKYLNGLGGYQREVGGIPSDVNSGNSNFCLNKDKTKIEDTLQSIGGSVTYKQVWNKHWASSVSANVMKLINREKILDNEKKYDNAILVKFSPFIINIAKNFTLSPSYTFGKSNIMPVKDGKSEDIHRFGLAVSYDI